VPVGLNFFIILTKEHFCPAQCILKTLIENPREQHREKFIAQEVSVDLCKEKYGARFEAVKNDVKETDDLRVLDYNGHHIFLAIPFSEMGEPYRYEG